MLPRGSLVVIIAFVLFLSGEAVLAESKVVYVTVRVDSEAEGYEGARAMDGDPRSLWHTKWSDGETKHPHEIVVDLGAVYEIEGFRCLPRVDCVNGAIKDYEFFVSTSDREFGPPAAKGTVFHSTGRDPIPLSPKKQGRYVKLRALSEHGGRGWTSIAELQILSPGVRFLAAGSPARKTEPQDLDDGTLETALRLARRTLAHVEKAAARPEMAAELTALERRAEKAGGDADREALYREVRLLRRKIIFSHPALDFPRLLINKRPPPGFSHQTDQYLGRHSGPGDGLVVLDDWKTDPKPTAILKDRLPPGSTLHPDLSFDATRVVFAFCDHTEPNPQRRQFFLYECNTDGNNLRQITGTAGDTLAGSQGRETALIEDWDPCYLPDGGIAFVSTRNQGAVRCHFGGRYCPTFTLFRCEPDGTRLGPMVYGEANEWDPSLLDDGRIIWTRWDYINRHDTFYQSLWTIRPDGTGTAHFYGNYTLNPCSILEARAITGSHEVVATAGAHHNYTSGSIIVIDPRRGQDGDAPLERVTPEIPFPETEGWGDRAAATPWPLGDGLFLCAYSQECVVGPEPQAYPGDRNRPGAYAICLIDTLGGREMIYRDPSQSCFAPIPIRPRPTPPVLPSRLPEATDETMGTFFVENVFHSTEDLPRERIKRLRVVEVFPQTAQCVPPRSTVLFETCKRIVGSVPIGEDGSVAFRVPAGRPLLFQLLDENDQCVMGMRSFVYLHPGETQGCVGCHEPRGNSPRESFVRAGTKVSDLEPPVGPAPEEGLGFARTVQPVLDRYCIGCHGLEKTEGGIDLSGSMPDGPGDAEHLLASRAYTSLTGKPGLVSLALRDRETPQSKPMDYFSHAGRLAGMLLVGDKNHPPLGGVGGLDRDSFRRIVYWLDLNAVFYGDYSWNKPDWRHVSPEGEKALREHIRATFGPKLAEEPYAALVNKAMPELSRILLAPLAKDAGGWGQIDHGWASTGEPGYRKMRELVEASLEPWPYRDVAGTSGRENGPCQADWIGKAHGAYRERVTTGRQPAAPTK